MNLIIYLILWIAIGLFVGAVSNWISSSRIWPWFWFDLAIGVIGAVGAAYFALRVLFNMSVVLSAYSIVMAILGASICMWLVWLIRRILR